jgi:hypothetical protein
LDSESELPGLAEVYYKGKRKFIPLLGGKPFPGQWNGVDEILNPYTLPSQDLKKLCTGNGPSLYWVLGQSLDQAAQALSEVKALPLHEALEAFFKSRKTASTERRYRRDFEELHAEGLLEGYQTAESLLRGRAQLNQKARSVGIEVSQHYALRAFLKFIEKPYSKHVVKGGRKQVKRRKDAKDEPLSMEERRAFLSKLGRIDPRGELIALLLINLNDGLNSSATEPEHRTIVSLEALLRLRAHEINGSMITLYETDGLIAMPLPPKLLARLCELAENETCYLFRQRKGAPLRSQQVNLIFKQAGDLAGIKNMSSRRLRPRPNLGPKLDLPLKKVQ